MPHCGIIFNLAKLTLASAFFSGSCNQMNRPPYSPWYGMPGAIFAFAFKAWVATWTCASKCGLHRFGPGFFLPYSVRYKIWHFVGIVIFLSFGLWGYWSWREFPHNFHFKLLGVRAESLKSFSFAKIWLLSGIVIMLLLNYGFTPNFPIISLAPGEFAGPFRGFLFAKNLTPFWNCDNIIFALWGFYWFPRNDFL